MQSGSKTAYARLIARAPELLHLVEQFHRFFDREGNPQPEWPIQASRIESHSPLTGHSWNRLPGLKPLTGVDRSIAIMR
jgi:hypothetical protein